MYKRQVSLITVLPEQLQSPLLTAEWEYRLGEIERGELAPEDFMDGISTMPVSYTHLIFEGGQSELLANVVAQIYAHLLQHPSRDPVGLSVYVELRYMTASLMLGEWFE